MKQTKLSVFVPVSVSYFSSIYVCQPLKPTSRLALWQPLARRIASAVVMASAEKSAPRENHRQLQIDRPRRVRSIVITSPESRKRSNVFVSRRSRISRRPGARQSPRVPALFCRPFRLFYCVCQPSNIFPSSAMISLRRRTPAASRPRKHRPETKFGGAPAADPRALFFVRVLTRGPFERARGRIQLSCASEFCGRSKVFSLGDFVGKIFSCSRDVRSAFPLKVATRSIRIRRDIRSSPTLVTKLLQLSLRRCNVVRYSY